MYILPSFFSPCLGVSAGCSSDVSATVVCSGVYSGVTSGFVSTASSVISGGGGGVVTAVVVCSGKSCCITSASSGISTVSSVISSLISGGMFSSSTSMGSDAVLAVVDIATVTAGVVCSGSFAVCIGSSSFVNCIPMTHTIAAHTAVAPPIIKPLLVFSFILFTCPFVGLLFVVSHTIPYLFRKV